MPRSRRRGPVLVLAALALPLLVAGQVVVGEDVGQVLGSGATGPGPAAPPVAVPTAGPTSGPTTAATTAPRQPVGDGPAAPSVGEPVDEVRLELPVGAVLDDEAVASLDPLVEVLGSPGAAPALVRGNAEPGPDPEAALALARQRADVVVEALVERGVPPQLLRTTATVDAEQGRSVVVVPDLP